MTTAPPTASDTSSEGLEVLEPRDRCCATCGPPNMACPRGKRRADWFSTAPTCCSVAGVCGGRERSRGS